jgi:hypothetical protein
MFAYIYSRLFPLVVLLQHTHRNGRNELGPVNRMAVSPHYALLSSPHFEFSAQEANRLADIGLNPFSHPGPLGGTVNTPDPIYRGMRAREFIEANHRA